MSNDLSNIRPLGDRVVIRKIEEKERMYGSIVIPKTANEIDLSWVAEVIAVGPGRVTEEGKLLEITDFRKGDKIVIGKYMGTEIKLDNQKFYVVRADDILGVFEED